MAHRTRTIRNQRRGFSLIEMMFAISIAGVAAFALLALMRHNADLQLRTEQRTLALAIAERVMEESRRTPFLELGDRDALEVPFYRGAGQAAEIEIRLFDEDGNAIPDGPIRDTYSFVRVEVTVTLNSVNLDGSPRVSNRFVVSETLVTWMVPPA